jgi:major membrane immunogen (membrane-anchored lipoprotein)
MQRIAVILLAGSILCLIGSGCGGSSASGNTEQGTTTKAKSSPATPQERVKEAVGDTVHAGGYAGDVKIDDVSHYQNFVTVTAETPQGGLEGAKCGDLDTAAGAIFEKVYKDTGWKGNATINFQGGLVNKATGKKLPHEQTGNFSIDPGQAKQIDWSNGDALANIDWSIYRDFCHPALQ